MLVLYLHNSSYQPQKFLKLESSKSTVLKTLIICDYRHDFFNY